MRPPIFPRTGHGLFCGKAARKNDTAAEWEVQGKREKGETGKSEIGRQSVTNRNIPYQIFPSSPFPPLHRGVNLVRPRQFVGLVFPPVSFTVTNASRNWCSAASNSSLSSAVRLPSVFCWSMASRSIECLACSRRHVNLIRHRIGHQPQRDCPLQIKCAHQEGEIGRGERRRDAGRRRRVGRLGGLGGVAGRFPLGFDLALPVFVNEEFLFGMLRFFGHRYTSSTRKDSPLLAAWTRRLNVEIKPW